MSTKTATEILREAAEVLEQRGKVRDTPSGERSMTRAVAAYTALRGDALVTPLDGWLFMCVLKLARATAGKGHVDDWTDLAGYAALGAECLSESVSEYQSLCDVETVVDSEPVSTGGDGVGFNPDEWIYVRPGHLSPVEPEFGSGPGLWFANGAPGHAHREARVLLRSGDYAKGKVSEFKWNENGDENDIVAYQYV